MESNVQQRSGVLFDLYGTLADVVVDELSPDFWAKLAAHTEAGKRAESAQRLRIIYDALMAEECAMGTKHGFLMDTLFHKLLTCFQVPESVETPESFARKFRKYSIVSLVLKPYTVSLLTILRKNNIAVGSLSNTEAILTNYDLTVSGLKPFFDSISLSSEIKREKPDPIAFDIATKRLGLPKSAVVYVGDNFADDVVGALSASMDVIYLNNESKAGHQYPPSQNRVIRADPSLRSILNALMALDILKTLPLDERHTRLHSQQLTGSL